MNLMGATPDSSAWRESWPCIGRLLSSWNSYNFHFEFCFHFASAATHTRTRTLVVYCVLSVFGIIETELLRFDFNWIYEISLSTPKHNRWLQLQQLTFVYISQQLRVFVARAVCSPSIARQLAGYSTYWTCFDFFALSKFPRRFIK